MAKPKVVGVFDILNQIPPFEPVARDEKTATSTRAVSSDELDYNTRKQLDGIVYVPNMVDSLLNVVKPWANSVVPDPNADNTWIKKNHPKVLFSGSTRHDE
ncbi:hypothetical protein PLICRDRAFT_44619 [Plicaturopsis crispa FD-325 SS-3]|nr:hypothetical protein PLICRDRAFT_44619 [Plicaturopsis crispa FD-325 SS-3]